MDRTNQRREHRSVSRAMRRSSAFRARIEKKRRRSILFITGAALAAALGFEFSVASFGGIGIAEAATNQARSLLDLLDARSPGARTAALLTKNRRTVLADREGAPKPAVPANLAEVLAPPAAEGPILDIGPELASLPPPPPGAILLPPPGGGVVVPPGGGGSPPGGGGTPPGGGGTPPGGGDTPPGGGDTPPPLPEPGTWTTMILGFGLAGWMLRRKRPLVARN